MFNKCLVKNFLQAALNPGMVCLFLVTLGLSLDSQSKSLAADETISFGQSLQNEDLLAHDWPGKGRRLVLIGAIHAHHE